MTPEAFTTTLLNLAEPHGDIPIYGSPEWCDLTATDPRRFASVARAAECWRLEGTPEAIRARLADEEWQVAARLRAASLDVSDAIDWDAVAAGHVTHADLQHRRYGWAVAS